MITIGRLAREYSMLPSEIRQRATTYDFMITDVLAIYEEYQRQKAEGTIDPAMFQLTEEEMLALSNDARERAFK